MMPLEFWIIIGVATIAVTWAVIELCKPRL